MRYFIRTNVQEEKSKGKTNELNLNIYKKDLPVQQGSYCSIQQGLNCPKRGIRTYNHSPFQEAERVLHVY